MVCTVTQLGKQHCLPVLQIRKLRHRKSEILPKDPQQVSGGARAQSQGGVNPEPISHLLRCAASITVHQLLYHTLSHAFSCIILTSVCKQQSHIDEKLLTRGRVVSEPFILFCGSLPCFSQGL